MAGEVLFLMYVFFPLSFEQNFVANEKSATAKLLSTTSEIGTCLFATLESHFSVAMHSDKSSAGNNSSIEAQRIKLYDKLNRTISSLVLSEDENSGNQPLSSQYKVAAQSQFSRSHLLILTCFSILTMGYYLLSSRLMII